MPCWWHGFKPVHNLRRCSVNAGCSEKPLPSGPSWCLPPASAPRLPTPPADHPVPRARRGAAPQHPHRGPRPLGAARVHARHTHRAAAAGRQRDQLPRQRGELPLMAQQPSQLHGAASMQPAPQPAAHVIAIEVFPCCSTGKLPSPSPSTGQHPPYTAGCRSCPSSNRRPWL